MECCGYLISDEHEGTQICVNCHQSFNDLKNYGTNMDSELSFIQNNTKVLLEQLKNVCANNHIEQSVEKLCSDYLLKIEKPKINDVIYCLHKACSYLGGARSLKEISDMFQLPVKNLSMYEGIADIVNPSDLVARACNRLAITRFQDIVTIGKKADDLRDTFLSASPPQSAVALAIMKHVQTCKFLSITLVDIAQASGVSISCLRRLNRLYKKEM